MRMYYQHCVCPYRQIPDPPMKNIFAARVGEKCFRLIAGDKSNMYMTYPTLSQNCRVSSSDSRPSSPPKYVT